MSELSNIPITTDRVDGILIAKLGKEIVAANFDSIEEAIRREIANAPALVLLDMENLQRISSAGAATLLSIDLMTSDKGGMLAICTVGSKIMEIMEILGLDNQLTITATREEAISKLKDFAANK